MLSNFKGSVGRGFSIIELLVVVGLIAILAAIAVPAYVGYTEKSKLVEGPKELSALRIRMEQYFQDNRTYVDNSGVNPTCGTTVPVSTNFTYACDSVDAVSYVWSASNKADVGLGSADAYTYTIDQLGAAKTTAHPKKAAGIKNCWLVRKREC